MKKFLVLLLLGVPAVVVCLVALVAPASADPGTLYVDDDGLCGGNLPCHTTIQAAINAANDGDTILVYPGTYDPQVDIVPPGWGGHYWAQGIVVWKANLTIRAVDPDPANTVIQNTLGNWMDWWRIQHLTGGVWTASPPNQTGGFNPGTSASPNALMIVKSGVTIQGFTFHEHVFTPGGGYNAAGVMIGGVAPGDPNSLGADNNVVTDNVFSDVWHAVYIWHSSGNQITDNTVQALGNTGHWAGMSIYDGYNDTQIGYGHLSANNVIARNTLADKGISVGAWQPTVPTNNSGTQIVGNTVKGDIGFYYTSSSGVEVRGNNVQAGPYSSGQIVFDGGPSSFTSCEVSGNTVGAGTTNGIQLSFMAGGSVSDNDVSGRTTNGIALISSSNVDIEGNTAHDNGASGIVLTGAGSSGNDVSGNEILHNAGNTANPGGLTIKNGVSSTNVFNNTINSNTQYGVWIDSTAGTGNVFWVNNIVANGVGMSNNTAPTVDAQDNWWGDATGPVAPNNVTSGPVDYDPWITCLSYTGDTASASPVVLEAKLVNSDGNGLLPTPVPGVSVEFFVDSSSKGVATTDPNGVAQVTVSLPSGVYAVRAVVKAGGLLGDCLAGCEATAPLTVFLSTGPSVGGTIEFKGGASAAPSAHQPDSAAPLYAALALASAAAAIVIAASAWYARRRWIRIR